MTERTLAIGLAALLSGGGAWAAEGPAKARSHQPTVRIIDQTTVIGDSDPALWKKVLDLLPIRPERIEVLDLDALSSLARQKLRGLDGFVLAGHTTIVVIRQGATLRQAEFGDAVDRLALASLVWHEMAHANGFDERAALAQERGLWHRFIAAGLVDSGVGLTYIARLQEPDADTRSRDGR